jgi:HK97 family phage prohead protease
MADLIVGDFVVWNSSGGKARGKITQIKKSGTLNIPDTDFTVSASEEAPAALIQVYEETADGWKPTDTKVGHKLSTLSKIPDLRNLQTEFRAVDLSPPEYMRAAARRGLKYHEEGLSGDGLVPQTVEDARKMAAGTITEAKWRKIAPWIARHMTDLDAVQDGEITAGVVAHLLWGSPATKSGARRTMEYAQKVVEQLDNQKKEERQMPPSYRPANSADVPAGRSCGNCEYFDTERSYCTAFDFACDADFYCDRWEPREEEMPEGETEMPEQEGLKVSVEAEVYIPTAWVVSQRNNRDVAYSNLELRAAGEGNTVVGYAAVWDSPSEPMPFTEFVKRGAFSKTLNDGADVRLLIDHEGIPLARSKSGTLRLEEDSRGLKVEADLDPSNPDAARIISAMRRGDISQMSFAFRTVKDWWNSDRSVRELREVQLFDVSIVTFPAYEETVAELRSANETVTVTPSSKVLLRKNQVALAKYRSR